MTKIACLSVSKNCFKWEFTDGKPVDVYIKAREHVFDSDTCGDRTSYWVLVIEGNPRFFKCKHEWYWSTYNDYEGHEESILENDFEIKEVAKGDLDDEAKGNLRFVV